MFFLTPPIGLSLPMLHTLRNTRSIHALSAPGLPSCAARIFVYRIDGKHNDRIPSKIMSHKIFFRFLIFAVTYEGLYDTYYRFFFSGYTGIQSTYRTMST